VNDAAAAAEPLVPLLDEGRRFSREREVRLADADLDGRLRLDAIARYLQDVANDDARAAIGPKDAAPWVVRKTTIDVFQWPRFQEPIELTTFCGGIGGRWAERRTTIKGRDGGHVEAASLWVHIDIDSGRPVPLPPSFLDVFGDGWGSRKVSGRLSHPAPPADLPRTRWTLRRTDFDVMGHVNNTAYWAIAEESLALDAPRRFELEYRLPVEPGHAPDLVVDADAGLTWLVSHDGQVHASARAIRLAS
jgi:acyl-ACP thioesterase